LVDGSLSGDLGLLRLWNSRNGALYRLRISLAQFGMARVVGARVFVEETGSTAATQNTGDQRENCPDYDWSHIASLQPRSRLYENRQGRPSESIPENRLPSPMIIGIPLA